MTTHTPSMSTPRSILLTGATGNLGSRLCQELLLGTPHVIYALVRDRDTASARARLHQRLAAVGEMPATTGRLHTVLADLTQPALGLSARDYDALAETVDTVVHCAASVNLVHSLDQLEPINLAGTRKLVALAQRRRILTGRSPALHHISTIGTLGLAVDSGLDEVSEETSSTVRTAGTLGYPRSKALAELELRHAHEQGFPVTIYRPGLITGDWRTGETNDTDALVPLTHAVLALGAAPTAGGLPADTIDTVVHAIVALIDHPDSPGHTYHLVRPHPLNFVDVFDAIRRAGRLLFAEEPAAWWQLAEAHAHQPAIRPVLAMSETYQKMLGIDPISRPPRIRCDTTWRVLRTLNVPQRPLDSAYFDRLAASIVDRYTPSGESISMTPAPARHPRDTIAPLAVRIDAVLDPQSFRDVTTGAAEASAACEAAGYGTIWVEEHRHDPFLVLAAAHAATTTIGIGTNILVALAHRPMTVARAANDLHAGSGGRLTLGVGTQIGVHLANRYSAPPDHRHARIREFVAALRAIWDTWNEGKPLNFRGEFFNHTLMTPFFVPPPNPYGSPRINMAAVGPRMAQVAGEVADGITIHSILSPDYIGEVLLPAAMRGLKRSGRSRDSFTVVCMPFIVTGRTTTERDAVAARIRNFVAFLGSTLDYRRALDVRDLSTLADRLADLSVTDDPNKWERMTDLIDDDVLSQFAIVSEPAGVGAAIRATYGALVDRVIIPTDDATNPGLWTPSTLNLQHADPTLHTDSSASFATEEVVLRRGASA
ncbi:TIGR03617 family F420-dependent LLM class oxidoreductase [Nocardia suismassiliense]|uniref:TIGR03617 family F420-dependent LLM class oxidoreductase n=1 Tax=Nocardia suismassiliense TaxID=2077092 RepID=UPI000D1E9674|nr:TIGR03617 family F420-dependent LLM class oxidoreductase [Nocardia suismassiliense]